MGFMIAVVKGKVDVGVGGGESAAQYQFYLQSSR